MPRATVYPLQTKNLALGCTSTTPHVFSKLNRTRTIASKVNETDVSVACNWNPKASGSGGPSETTLSNVSFAAASGETQAQRGQETCLRSHSEPPLRFLTASASPSQKEHCAWSPGDWSQGQASAPADCVAWSRNSPLGLSFLKCKMPGRGLNPSGVITFHSHKSVVHLGQNHSPLSETPEPALIWNSEVCSLRDRYPMFHPLPLGVWGSTNPDSAVKNYEE